MQVIAPTNMNKARNTIAVVIGCTLGSSTVGERVGLAVGKRRNVGLRVGEVDGALTARATEASFVQQMRRILSTIPSIFLVFRLHNQFCCLACICKSCLLDDELSDDPWAITVVMPHLSLEIKASVCAALAQCRQTQAAATRACCSQEQNE